jgi:hypothetical protein
MLWEKAVMGKETNGAMVRLIARETERRLQEAMLDFMRYGKGYAWVLELQLRYAAYVGMVQAELYRGADRRALAA